MKYRGFTLIELLIVVIVIGILATLMLPQMGTMAERARTAEAKNILGAIRTLMHAYYIESSVWPPVTESNTSAKINTAVGTVIGDSSRRLYEYATATGAVVNERYVIAERNVNAGGGSLGTHTVIRIKIYSDGSADTMEINNNKTGAGIATGATATW